MQKKSLFEYIEAFANSHIGSVRSENQDFFGVVKSDSFQAFFVADGMGGAKGGQVAASECVKKMGESLKALSIEPTIEELKKITKEVNQYIFQMALDSVDLRGMGTTMVGLTFCQSRVLMVTVGDSRVYRYRGGKLYQLSVDHTVWNDLVTSGSILPSSDFAQEISHMLTRSMGPDEEVEPDVCEIQVEAGDTYLLCSDGLYDMVTEGEMVQALRLGSAGKSIDKLIKLANSGGGKDNITAMVIKVKKGAQGIFPTCKEDLPGLRDCDLLAVKPALQSVSAKVEEVVAMADMAVVKKGGKRRSTKKTRGQTTDGKDSPSFEVPDPLHEESQQIEPPLTVAPFAQNSRLVPYLVAGSIIAISMFITVVFGVWTGVSRSKPVVHESSKSCPIDHLTDDDLIRALQTRQLTAMSPEFTAAHQSLLDSLSSAECNLSNEQKSAALGVLSMALKIEIADVAKEGGNGESVASTMGQPGALSAENMNGYAASPVTGLVVGSGPLHSPGKNGSSIVEPVILGSK